MSILDSARQLQDNGSLSAEAVGSLVQDGRPVEELMLSLTELAKTFAVVPVSDFQVGAVGLGTSGAVYLGANIEFAGFPLNQSVHAEQAMVVNAANAGETGLTKLAVNAAPCGHCRQFLNELGTADQLTISLPQRPSTKLSEFLPSAFGPGDLGVSSRLLEPQSHRFEWVTDTGHTDLAESTLRAVRRSYAPYSHSPAAVGLHTHSGTIVTGAYLENVAFNPSLASLQSAIVALTWACHSLADVSEVAIVQLVDSRIDHASASRVLLDRLAPDAILLDLSIQKGSTP